jgi:hypothetical protein
MPTSGSGSVVFIFLAGNARSTKMSRVGCINACFTVILLGLSGQQAMAQGQLAIEPYPLDSITSPYALGPVQKFGDFSPGYVGRFSSPRPGAVPQAQTAHNRQAQTPRRQSARAVPPTALRSAARQQEARRATAGAGPVLSLAPRYGERRPSTPFCFPASTIHIQQDERCKVGAPTYRARFEELLGE